MRYLINILMIVTAIFAVSSNSYAAPVMEWQDQTEINLLNNAGFENGKAGYTVSAGSIALTTSAANVISGKTSLVFTASAASQTVQTKLFTIPKGLSNGECQSELKYYTDSSVYRARVLNSSGAVLAEQALLPVSNTMTTRIFFPCSFSGTTSVRSDLISSGTASGVGITYDDNWLGSAKNLKNGAIVGPWQPYTPAITAGSGSLTNYTLLKTEWSRSGENMYIRGRLNFNGAAGTWNTPIITLPKGLSAKTSGPLTAEIQLNDSGASLYRGVANVGTNYNTVTLYAMNSSAGGYGSLTQVTPFSWASPDYMEWTIGPIQIEGWAGTGTTFDSSCPNDASCENIFNANVSTAGVVTGDKHGFIQSCTSFAPAVCTFRAGFFTSAPRCWASGTNNASSNFPFDIAYTGITSIVVDRKDELGARRPQDFTLFCRKTGADIVEKRTIEGFLSKNMTHSGDAIKREAWATFGGAGSFVAPTVCSTSPCTNYGSDSAITGVTRSSTGTYTMSIVPGTFTSLESIIVSQSTNPGNATKCSWVTATTTSVVIGCHNSSTVAPLDSAFSIEIKGTR